MGKRHVEIAGGGIAGLTAAAAFAQRGWSVRLHERGSELREIGAGIFIWENGLKVLENIGAFEEAVANGEFDQSFTILDENHDQLDQIKLGPGNRLYTVLRTDLHRAIANAAIKSGVEVVTNSHVVGASPEGELYTEDGKTYKADLVIGADGVHSKVRESLKLTTRYDALEDGCARLLIPRKKDERKGVIFEYWNEYRRVGIVPCSPNHIYVYLISREDDESGKTMPVQKETWIEAFPHLQEFIDRIGTDGRRDRLSYVDCSSWSAGRVALIGDAAHAMPPNLGQGACLALTNALALAKSLDGESEMETALKKWEERERPITETAQKWSYYFGIVSNQWPKEIMDVRNDIIKKAVKSEVLENQLLMAARHVV